MCMILQPYRMARVWLKLNIHETSFSDSMNHLNFQSGKLLSNANRLVITPGLNSENVVNCYSLEGKATFLGFTTSRDIASNNRPPFS